MNESRLNIPEWTVSEISSALKRTIEDAYAYVRVRGELGNVKYHSSGHVYLDLKDDKACLAGVMWRANAARIKLKLEAGLERKTAPRAISSGLAMRPVGGVLSVDYGASMRESPTGPRPRLDDILRLPFQADESACGLRLAAWNSVHMPKHAS